MTTRWTRALVTGASSGIGRAIATALLAEGTDVVAVARDRGRLEQLTDTPGRVGNVEVLDADLSDPTALELVASRVAATSDPVDLLVNNAGFGFVGLFGELDVEQESSVIAVNVLALTRLCHAAVSSFPERGGGAVLNVSSVAGFIPGARTATYNATKAFVNSFSSSLDLEYRPHGVTVTALCPGLTRTEFHERADYDASEFPSFLWQTAEDVATAGLDGVAAGKAQVIPGGPNKAAAAAAQLAPDAILRRVVPLLDRS